MTVAPAWKAGASSASLVVPVGTPMGGYAARTGGAERTLDPLTVSCLALEVQGDRFALVAVDLIGVDEEMVEEIARRTGLPETSIALCPSHTHSGPAGVLKRLHPAENERIDAALRNAVLEAASRVVCEAFDSLADATLRFGQAWADGVSANRNNVDGLFDPTVSVVSAHTVSGGPIATVVHFACHPTILPASSNVISAEFPGAIRSNLSPDEFGIVLFINGAAGDVSTRFTRRSQDASEVRRVGAVVAEAVKAADTPVTLAPALDMARKTGSIHLRDRDEIERAIEVGKLAAARLQRDDLSAAERRIEETRLQGVEILSQIAARIDTIPEQISVCAWKLGDLSLIGFPGELFASLGAELTRSQAPALVLGYANGYRGYFPDRAAYEAGTYEALSSPYAPGASEELVTWLRSQW